MQRHLAYTDLQPTFHEEVGRVPHPGGVYEDRSGSTLGPLLIAGIGGIAAGVALMTYRSEILCVTRRLMNAVRSRDLSNLQEPCGKHVPFHPDAKELNTGVGALSPQQYRSTEEQHECVMEASEESFPASDPPSWTGMSVGRTKRPGMAVPGM